MYFVYCTDYFIIILHTQFEIKCFIICNLVYTVTVLIIRGDLCSRISRFKKKREIK